MSTVACTQRGLDLPNTPRDIVSRGRVHGTRYRRPLNAFLAFFSSFLPCLFSTVDKGAGANDEASSEVPPGVLGISRGVAGLVAVRRWDVFRCPRGGLRNAAAVIEAPPRPRERRSLKAQPRLILTIRADTGVVSYSEASCCLVGCVVAPSFDLRRKDSTSPSVLQSQQLLGAVRRAS